MSYAASPSRSVVVVDDELEGYEHLLTLPDTRGWNFHFLRTARDAIRLGCGASASLWLVKTQLPDACGFALLEQLRQRIGTTPVCMVDASYRREHELAAYNSNPYAAYLCKPVDIMWLASWRCKSIRGPT